METRAERNEGGGSRVVMGAFGMLGVLGWGRGQKGRKFGTQNFVKMNGKS